MLNLARNDTQVLSQIPKFGLVLVVVLRPRCAGVLCSEKSPIVPQLFCSVILIMKHLDFRGRGRRRARGSPISEFRFSRSRPTCLKESYVTGAERVPSVCHTQMRL